jgi:hypothetical protein
VDDRLQDLADRLDGLAEDLADVALDRLRSAAGSDDPAPASAEERRITRARRSVEKAAALLRGTG